MAELIRHRREWMFYVELDEGEAPDMKKSYGDITFRPSGFYFTLKAHDSDVPRLSGATIAGPRILKSGEPGATTASEKYLSAGKLPDWALAYFSKAVEGVVNGIY